MLERNKLLDALNEILQAERGDTLSEDSLLTDSNMDSFSYAVFWLTLSDLGMDLNDKWIDTLDYEELTVGMILNKIQEKNT